jgi:ABC-2 type transport system ATP-binding protein
VTKSAVEVRGVTKTFTSAFGLRGHSLGKSNETPAVDDLSFTVPTGSVFGFIGPNGSGKTTTLRMIMNILVPDRGDITVLGEGHGFASRDRVTYLPEERGLYKKMTVTRLLSYYGQLKGVSADVIDGAIPGWLERMGLAAYAHKKVEALSKGMSQKVQFIAAVISNPELIILDEPFSGLDPVNGEVLKEAVLDLRKKGKTIIFSTHDMAMAERLCDRICMVFKGKKVLDGTLAEIHSAHGDSAAAETRSIHVRSALDATVLAALPGVEAVRDQGRFFELRVRGDAQELLRLLVAKGTVEKFEIARPSLHDIFVRIARPEGETYRHA